ncbi:MAG: G5 domain-containing protein, partial [Chloroflexi bacterium]|nr:G5 domain-containing protein [Chloroflexota bacterium]
MKVNRGAGLLLALFLWGCQPAAGPAAPKSGITVQWDSQTTTFTTARATVRDVLQDLGIQLGTLDRVVPGELAMLSDGMLVKVTRVVELLESETVELPFEKQVVRNEGLAAGGSRLLQTGVNGSEEITWRVVQEDGSVASRAVLRRTVLVAPVPEIVMVSAQTNFTVIPIEGTLAYLSAGNAWLVRTDSGQRRPLTTSGDL